MKIHFLIVLVVVGLAGCQSQSGGGSKREEPFRRAEDKGTVLVELRYSYSLCYWVDGTVVSTNLDEVIREVRKRGANGVRFVSEYKMVSESKYTIIDRFGAKQIEVLEFWTPLATAPGSNDLVQVERRIEHKSNDR
jgi:hypothetical protein